MGDGHVHAQPHRELAGALGVADALGDLPELGLDLLHRHRQTGREALEDHDEALPGDLCAIAKVDELHYDAVLHDAPEDEHIHLKPLEFPVPVHGLAISPMRHGDEQRMWEILTRLIDAPHEAVYRCWTEPAA